MHRPLAISLRQELLTAYELTSRRERPGGEKKNTPFFQQPLEGRSLGVYSLPQRLMRCVDSYL